MKNLAAQRKHAAGKFFILHLSIPLLHPDHRQLYAFPFGIYAEYLLAYLLVDGHDLVRV